MDYSKYTRRIELPPGFDPPTELRFEDITARALSRADLAADVKGINASLDLIRKTRGGGWPTEPVTEEFNYIDLVWHECEFRERYSFAYAIYADGTRYLGCAYFYPMGRRTPLSESLLDHDIDVSWWVTPDAYQRGCYVKLYNALRKWSVEAYPFRKPHFSNLEIPQ